MEILLRLLMAFVSLITTLLNMLLNFIMPRRKPNYPPIKNPLLMKSMCVLLTELKAGKITTEEIVKAYIERIQQVNPILNAVIEDRFEQAIKEAQHADRLIEKARKINEIPALYARYPLLGIPFTVKEACGVKGLSFVVGSVHRKYEKCEKSGTAVEKLCEAGCIPLLVSANPEFCLSFETNTHTHGRCLNPYDLNRTTAGSSGGEGALNGSGATVFGLGSDIAGSIRLPAMFCGIYGHKPTGKLVSVNGHFPNSSSQKDFDQYLQLGPMSRFACDLPVLLQIMAGKNADKLKLSEGIRTQDIKIYYAFGFDGINSLTHPPVSIDIREAIKKAVKCFSDGGLSTEHVKIRGFRHSLEICIANLVTLEGVPSPLTQSELVTPSRKSLVLELLRSLIGHSLYTKEAVFMDLMKNLHGLMSQSNLKKWCAEVEVLRDELIKLLGKNGVLFFPTFHSPAFCFNTSILNLVSIDMMTLFNVLGFPVTQVPMGLTASGLPIGFQIIAAPYQDKLSLQIAVELETVLGGWVPPQTELQSSNN